MGGVDSLLCVLGVELGAGADQLPGGWVVDLEGLARGGLDPFAIDVADIGLEEGRVPELDARMCLSSWSLGQSGKQRDKTYLGHHG